MKIDDVIKGVKKKDERKYNRPSAIPVDTPIYPDDMGGAESAKVRTKKWERIRKEETLERIRLKKLSALLAKQEEVKQIEEEKKNINTAITKAKRVIMLFRMVMTDEAFNWMELYLKINEPEIYKELFKRLAPPELIMNVEKIAWDFHNAFKRGKLTEADKLNYDSLVLHYREIKGIKPKIEVDRHGKRKPIL